MFVEWFQQKYEEWRENKYGREASQAEFARYLDISYQSVNEYLHGKTKPAYGETLDKLFAVYGPEVYDVLEMERPVDVQVKSVAERIQKLDRQARSLTNEELIGEIRKLAEEFGYYLRETE